MWAVRSPPGIGITLLLLQPPPSGPLPQVKVLDRITRYPFGNDPELMAEWKAARQLLGQSGNKEGPPPAPSGDVKQAA